MKRSRAALKTNGAAATALLSEISLPFTNDNHDNNWTLVIFHWKNL